MYSVTKQFLVDQYTRLIHDRSGATMVEYGLIAGTIGIAVLITTMSIGETLRDDIYGAVVNALSSSSGSGSSGSGSSSSSG